MNNSSSGDHIYVIVPAYNEETYIEKVLKKLKKHTDSIVVVDDGSTDNTFALAQDLVPHSLRHIVNLGKGAALKTGCEYAFYHLDAKAVIFLDSDDQHDPAEIRLFADKLQQGNELVLGVRKMSATMPKHKQVFNQLASQVVAWLFGVKVPDIPSGYKAMTKKAYEKIRWNSTDYGVELEIAAKTAKYKLPFATVEISTIYHDYDRGMTMLDVIRMSYKLLGWKLTL